MSVRVTKDTVATACRRTPQLLECLTPEERQIAEQYFSGSKNYTSNNYLLVTAKRKLANAALALLASGTGQPLAVSPSDVWDDDESMQSYLQEWLNIGVLVNSLQESVDVKLRDVVVRSIFNFHAKYKTVEARILDHEFMDRWPNV